MMRSGRAPGGRSSSYVAVGFSSSPTYPSATRPFGGRVVQLRPLTKPVTQWVQCNELGPPAATVGPPPGITRPTLEGWEGEELKLNRSPARRGHDHLW